VARRRVELGRQRIAVAAERGTLDARIKEACGAELTSLDQQITGAAAQGRPEYGYHSAIELRQDAEKWVQVDLGAPVAIDRVVLAPCNDSFNDIGPGFGNSVRAWLRSNPDSPRPL
jgi:hypothetical protein